MLDHEASTDLPTSSHVSMAPGARRRYRYASPHIPTPRCHFPCGFCLFDHCGPVPVGLRASRCSGLRAADNLRRLLFTGSNQVDEARLRRGFISRHQRAHMVSACDSRQATLPAGWVRGEKGGGRAATAPKICPFPWLNTWLCMADSMMITRLAPPRISPEYWPGPVYPYHRVMKESWDGI